MFKFFINNPVFSSVISIIIVLCGIVALFSLPLEEYPDITPPTITISAHYPGANSVVLQKTVASPIEDQINGANHMIYMNSVMSSNGDYNLVITFSTGTDLNSVTGDVLNRLNTSLPILPSIVQNLGVTMRKSSQNSLMNLSIQSNGKVDMGYLSNYTFRNINSELLRIKGVGDIQVVGARAYSMRIWMKPDIMQKLGVTVNDIESAITDQNIQVASGQTGAPPTEGKAVLVINLIGQNYFSNPVQFENIVIRNNGIQFIKLKDVARIELGALNYDTINKLNTTPTVGLQIFLNSEANQIQVHNEIINKMDDLASRFPEGISYKVAYDNTKFIKKALSNVADTFRDSCILVILVIFLFLQKPRATLIPLITIPVAIIGTFAGMYLTNFTINNLTLFGLILSIGIVVDDSIVVIENVERIMVQEKLSAKKASIKTMNEVASALIAIILVLFCAFIPSTFLGGLTGILYRQFAITISISVILSGVVALTLTPALCAIFLKDDKSKVANNKLFLYFNSFFEKLTDYYLIVVKCIINKRNWFLFLYILLLLVTCLIFYKLPVGFIPNEDKGFFVTQVTLPNNSSILNTEKVTDEFSKYLLGIDYIENTNSIIGLDQLHGNSIKGNVSTNITSLIDWDKRKLMDVNEAIDNVNNYSKNFKNAKLISYNVPPIDGLGSSNGVEFYLQDIVNGDYFKLDQYSKLITKELNKNSAIKNSYYTFNPNNQAYEVMVDTEKAKLYNLQIQDIYKVLSANYGPDLINYFYKIGDLYWVTLQSDYMYRKTPFMLDNLWVRSSNNNMVPVNSVVNTKFTTQPDVIERVNNFLASKIIVEPNKNTTINDTIAIIKDLVDKIIPKEYSYVWYGVSYLQQNTNKLSSLAFIFAMIVIFLVLSAQFEMWRLPLVVLLAIPFALFGAGISLYLRSLSNDLYFQISLITLLGLSAKNAILIVEFSLEHWKIGVSIIDATLLAAKQRFRPIIMTSLAFILGTIPLVFSTGANSNAQHSVGTGILGGMIGSTFISTLFIPMFFVIIMGKKKYISDES